MMRVIKKGARFDVFIWLSGGLRYTLLVGGCGYVLSYVYVALVRLAYPFELEWIEGAMVEHARRILSGQKIYVRPTLEFIPYAYPPLYYYLSALFAQVLGIGFFPLRLVSFLSSLGCGGVIFLFVKRATQRLYPSLLASSLFAATFGISGYWFDLAKVDSLFLVLVLGTLYFIEIENSSWAWSVAGISMSLAFLTKQTGLIIAGCLSLYCLLSHWRRSVFFIAPLLAIIGGSTFILDWIHHGWYRYYIFTILSQHVLEKKMLLYFWSQDIASHLGIVVCGAIFFLYVQYGRSKQEGMFYSFVSGGMIVSAWLPRLKAGGAENNLMPVCAILAILFGLALNLAFDYTRRLTPAKQRVVNNAVYVICLIQFLGLAYNPWKQLPTPQDVAAGTHFLTRLSQIEGEILMPCHGYLLALLGKQSFAHEMAIQDNLTSKENEVKSQLTQEIRQAITRQRFQAIILDHEWWFSDDVKQAYRPQEQLFPETQAFWPITGYQTRPSVLYVPKRP